MYVLFSGMACKSNNNANKKLIQGKLTMNFHFQEFGQRLKKIRHLTSCLNTTSNDKFFSAFSSSPIQASEP